MHVPKPGGLSWQHYRSATVAHCVRNAVDQVHPFWRPSNSVALIAASNASVMQWQQLGPSLSR